MRTLTRFENGVPRGEPLNCWALERHGRPLERGWRRLTAQIKTLCLFNGQNNKNGTKKSLHSTESLAAKIPIKTKPSESFAFKSPAHNEDLADVM